MSGLRLSRFFATTPHVAAASQQAATVQVGDIATTGGTLRTSEQPRSSVSAFGPKLPVVVLTGGPCGGKSSLLRALKQPRALGDVRVLGLSEAATDLSSEGIGFDYHSDEQSCAGERTLVQLQCARENAVMEHTKRQGVPAVVVCDRGAMDGAAYCEPSIWQHVLADCDVTEEALCARYDFVLHITSIAVDKPALYQTSNNAARMEDSDDAAALDAKTAVAWRKHPSRHVLSNDFPSFEAKMAEGQRQVARFVESYYAKPASHESQGLRLVS